MANTCLATTVKVLEKPDCLFEGLAERAAEVQCRWRTTVQAQVDAAMATANLRFGQTDQVDLTLVSV